MRRVKIRLDYRLLIFNILNKNISKWIYIREVRTIFLILYEVRTYFFISLDGVILLKMQ